MGQIIMVGSYCGLSSYVCEVTVTGRRLEIEEVRSLRLVDDNSLRRHQASDYSYEWYEIGPGDQIKIRIGELGEDEELVFEVPSSPLSHLPQKLDDDLGPDLLLVYLRTHYQQIK